MGLWWVLLRSMHYGDCNDATHSYPFTKIDFGHSMFLPYMSHHHETDQIFEACRILAKRITDPKRFIE
jgi:hypothetical protein